MTFWSKLWFLVKYRTWPQVFDASNVEWSSVTLEKFTLDTMSVWVDDGSDPT